MKKTVIFYSHNFGGLGHNKRLSLIIKELLNNFGNAYNCILLNSGEKQDYLFSSIKGLKIINLPKYNFENYKIIGNYKTIESLRKIIFKKLFLLNIEIEALIIEHYPFGRNFLNNEIKFLISEFKKYNYKGNIFSSVRDIFDFNSLNKENLVYFDRILIHGDKKLFNYEYKFEENINKKIIYTGYVVEENIDDNEIIENIIYINIGGGQDGLDYVKDFLVKLCFVENKYDYKIIISLGNNYNDSNIKYLNDTYDGEIEFYKYLDNSIELKFKSILCVSMGGYNNMVESLKYCYNTIIYPRLIDDEQLTRLKKFQEFSENIHNGLDLGVEDIKKLLLKGFKKDVKLIDLKGAYFTSNLIVNYRKYKYIKIRLTNACNAKCDMCGVIKREIKYNKIYNIEKSILDFYKLGGDVVNFTGGEPTIYNGFWDLLVICKKLGFITSVSTNGSTLGDIFIKKLSYNSKLLIDYMDISVDGLYEKQDIRRNFNGLFNKIANNIKLLLDLGVFIHINVTIRKDNIFEVREIFNYFKDIGVNSISFGMIDNSPINDTTAFIPNRESLIYYYTTDKEYILKNTKDIKVVFSPDFKNGDFNDLISGIIKGNNFIRQIGKNCNFIKSKKEIRINEGGNISPCCEIDDFDEGIGNINNENLLNIICSKNYEVFLNRVFPNISEACLNCKIEV